MKIKNYILGIAALCLISIGVNAQKVAHINAQGVLVELPDYENANMELEEYAAGLKKEYDMYEGMYKEKEAAYMAKEKKCMANPDACDKDILEMEYNDLMASAQKLEEIKYNIQTKLQEREGILINKLVEKIKAKAAEVAKEKGYTYVLDSSTLIVAMGEDISELVKNKLIAP